MTISPIKHTLECMYKKKPIGRFEYKPEDLHVKEQFLFYIPEERSTKKYPKGYYTVIRYKEGSVKIFDSNKVELYVKPFILNCIKWLENLSDASVVDISASHNTRLLAYRFIRDLKVGNSK